jgi:SAM-dependent methyltransferase
LNDDRLTRSYPANYDAHARSVPADAHWKQVRRTVGGEPVDETQIDLIVEAITAGLSLAQTDVVLDLACGNGALSAHLFDRCGGLVGVDISPYLIEIAQNDFGRPPHYRFQAEDALLYLQRERNPSAFTKAVFYGAFQYFPRADAVLALQTLHARFQRVSSVFIGNVPDKSRLAGFYRDEIPDQAELNDHEAQIGVWYLPEEFAALGRASGWRVSLSFMPAQFYGSRYRFDATLERVKR